MRRMSFAKAIEICDELEDTFEFLSKSPMTRELSLYYKNIYEPKEWKFWKPRARRFSIVLHYSEFTSDGIVFKKRYDMEVYIYEHDVEVAFIKEGTLGTLRELIDEVKVDIMKRALGDTVLKELRGGK